MKTIMSLYRTNFLFAWVINLLCVCIWVITIIGMAVLLAMACSI